MRDGTTTAATSGLDPIPRAGTEATSGLVFPAPGRHRIDEGLGAARDWLLARQDAGRVLVGRARGGHDARELHDPAGGVLRPARQRQVARPRAHHPRRGASRRGLESVSGRPRGSVGLLPELLRAQARGRPRGRASLAPFPRGDPRERRRRGGEHVHQVPPGVLRPVSWKDVPAIPPEMVFLPGRSPFSIYDMSSWSRTIFVPLSILWAAKPVCPLPAASRRRRARARRANRRGPDRRRLGEGLRRRRPPAQRVGAPSGRGRGCGARPSSGPRPG